MNEWLTYSIYPSIGQNAMYRSINQLVKGQINQLVNDPFNRESWKGTDTRSPKHPDQGQFVAPQKRVSILKAEPHPSTTRRQHFHFSPHPQPFTTSVSPNKSTSAHPALSPSHPSPTHTPTPHSPQNLCRPLTQPLPIQSVLS